MPSTTTEAGPPLRRGEIALLLLAVLATRVLVRQVCHVYDDAFITYRYAQQLASGQGLVFHAGERVLGTTTPGYAVLLACFGWSGASVVAASLVVNLVADLGVALLLCLELRARRLVATFAVLGYAALPQLARVSVGGMEAPLLCLVALAACRALPRGRVGLAGVLAAIACTLRPEAVLLVGVLAWSVRRDRLALLGFLMPVIALGSAYTLALTAYYGSPLPQSVLSKASRHGGSPLFDTWREILQQAFLPHLLAAPLLPLVAWGTARTLRGGGPLRSFSLFALAMVAAYLVARPHTWGWYFFVPLAAWVLWLAEGGVALIERFVPRLVRPRAPLASWGPTALPILALLAVAAATWGRRDLVTERVYRPMAEWTRSVELARTGERVLASDIGAIGYLGMGRVLDTEGLVWPEAVRHGGSQMELVDEHRPEYLLLTAVRAKIGPLRERADITRAYYPIRRFSVLGRSELEPRLAELPDHWVQDYLLYRRKDP